MHLARVTRDPVGHAAATGSGPDPLALLLGGESGAGGPAFPAALQAALADGEVADEALDVADGEDDASGENETGISLDAALAAALGLGAVVNPSAPKGTETADGGEPDLDPQAVQANASPRGTTGQPVIGGNLGATSAAASTDGAVVASTAGVATSAGGVATGTAGMAASTATVATSTAAVDSHRGENVTDERFAADEAVAAAVRPGPNPTGSGHPVGTTCRAVPPADVTVPAAAAVLTCAAADAAPAEIAAGRPTPQAAPAGSTSGAHHGVGAAAGVSATSFSSSGGSEQQALDLGTSDRQAFALVGKPAIALTTATEPGHAGEKIHATTTATGGGAGDVTTALPPAITTSAPQDGATTRTQPTAQHPTGIEARWGERVVEALRLASVRGGGEIRLQLEPEGLGHIDVRLHLQPDGVRAVIVAEHESTRVLLSSQQHVLQDAFNRSDLRLSGFSVDVGSGGEAATFGREGAPGHDGGAPSSAVATAATASPVEESTAASLANGRVNVRV